MEYDMYAVEKLNAELTRLRAELEQVKDTKQVVSMFYSMKDRAEAAEKGWHDATARAEQAELLAENRMARVNELNDQLAIANKALELACKKVAERSSNCFDPAYFLAQAKREVDKG